MNQYTNVLKKFGLTENEAKVYIESLKENELSPFQISKLTGIPRTTVYDVLMNLALKGLVELDQSDGLQKQQTKVRAKNPSILRKILQKRRDDSFKIEADIVEILPSLKEIFHKDESNADFQFYPGIEGIRRVYLNIESQDIDQDCVSWTQLMPLDVFGSKDINKDVHDWNDIRLKNKTTAKVLIPLNEWTKHVLTYQYQLDNRYLDNRDFRYIESPMFEMFLDLVVQGNYIKIACSEGDEVWGIIIKSEAMAKSFKSMFNVMWSMATPVTKEFIENLGENKLLKEQKKLKS